MANGTSGTSSFGPSGAIQQYMQNQGYQYNSDTGQWGKPQPVNTTLGQYQKQLDTAPQNFSDIMSGLQSQIGKTAKQASPELGAAMNTMEGNLATGGYSDSDISELRARAISPIRSIYMNAMNNVNRQRNLQGGYSPNATAALAKMAREQSGQISDATTNVNANLAQMVAQGRANAAQALGPLAATTTGADLSRNLSTLGNMSSLFGTSPGMLSTLGNQVLGAQQISDQQQRFMDQMQQQSQLAELAGLMRM